eukprot:1200119-Rhodomonas_salina.1
MQGHTQVCTHCQSTQPLTLRACLRVGRATLPRLHLLYEHASGSGELLQPPTLRACLRVGRATPSTDSTSTPP